MSPAARIRFPTVETRKGTFLPERHWPGHELCFFLHDVMAELLAAGKRAGAFHVKFQLSEDEVSTFNKTDDVFQWLDQNRPPEDRAGRPVTRNIPPDRPFYVVKHDPDFGLNVAPLPGGNPPVQLSLSVQKTN
jgi:hypothetical protein